MKLEFLITDFEKTINLNRFMLKIFGLWPPDNRNSRQIVRLKPLCSVIAFIFIIIIPSLMSLMKVWGDMILMIDNMQFSLPFSIALLKACIIWYKQEDLAPLIDMMETDWTKVKIKEERDVMLKYTRIPRAITVGAFLMIFLILIIIFGLPCFEITKRYVTNLNNTKTDFPIPTYYLHDVTKSPHFELTLLAQLFIAFTSGTSYSGIDNLFGLLVFHVCGQMENLHLRLVHMKKYSNYNEVLKYNIQDHIRLIRTVEIIDDSFNLMLLNLILFFGIIFCLQGFLIVNVIKRKDQLSVMQLTWFVFACIFILLHMCLYCAVGEILVTQSEKIHHATYEYEWYTIEPRAAKNLILIMLRAHKPLHITAGKTFPMTMATFCSLLKTSAGYISVLLANQD